MPDTGAIPPRFADARIAAMLEAPVLPTLLRLAAPNLGEAAARIAFLAADAVFIGWLGPEALAGVSLALPLFLLTQMVSASGFGTGVAAGVARALGAGRRAEAEGLAAHALWIAVAAAALVGFGMLAFGPALYAAFGAKGAALDAAVTWSAIVFGGGIVVWTQNLLANVVRGTGRMAVSAGAIVAGEAVHLALSPLLVLGWGSVPSLGVAGAAIAVLAAYATGAGMLLWHLAGRERPVRLMRAAFVPQRALFHAILGVGGLASANILLFQAAAMLATALVAGSGAMALAGFGAAQRLELLQLPLAFALGSAVIAMVAANLGAGQPARAARVACVGAALSALIGLDFALLALLWPEGWMRLFLDDPGAVSTGAAYLRAIGWVLPALGLGLGVVFALFGAGRAGWPALAGGLRLAMLAAGGMALPWLEASELPALFTLVAGAALIFAVALLPASWPVLHAAGSDSGAARGRSGGFGLSLHRKASAGCRPWEEDDASWTTCPAWRRRLRDAAHCCAGTAGMARPAAALHHQRAGRRRVRHLPAHPGESHAGAAGPGPLHRSAPRRRWDDRGPDSHTGGGQPQLRDQPHRLARHQPGGVPQSWRL